MATPSYMKSTKASRIRGGNSWDIPTTADDGSSSDSADFFEGDTYDEDALEKIARDAKQSRADNAVRRARQADIQNALSVSREGKSMATFRTADKSKVPASLTSAPPVEDKVVKRKPARKHRRTRSHDVYLPLETSSAIAKGRTISAVPMEEVIKQRNKTRTSGAPARRRLSISVDDCGTIPEGSTAMTRSPKPRRARQSPMGADFLEEDVPTTPPSSGLSSSLTSVEALMQRRREMM